MPLFRSLRARVLLWVSVALVVLFALTIVGLDLTFRRSTDRSLEEVLQAQMLGLIALAEPDSVGQLSIPDEAVDPRFDVADSGLYAVLCDQHGEPIWQSPSLLGRDLPVGSLPAPGESRQLRLEPADLPPMQVLLMGITWEFSDERVVPYSLGIAVSLEPYQARQRAFRWNLVGWFGGVTLVMLIVITGLLTWVLRPLRRLQGQVADIEAGRRRGLSGRFPSELMGLAGSLNALIDTERRRQIRYRDTLDDLAHSLKTPLAALRSLVSERAGGGSYEKELDKELDRMDQRVSYQLRKARASGATGLGVEPTYVGPLAGDLKATLDKVYRDKHVECALEIAGDLMEILGNLLDNAYKYCRRRVKLEASMSDGRLIIVVTDDGAGISSANVEAVLERGAREDETVPGQGIGLAVVKEIVALYRGSLRFADSAWGGTAVRVELGRAGASA
jgi:two-component system sensor histidine kinase PhoQ